METAYTIEYDPLSIKSNTTNLLRVTSCSGLYDFGVCFENDFSDVIQIPSNGLSLNAHATEYINRFYLCQRRKGLMSVWETLDYTFLFVGNHNADWTNRVAAFVHLYTEYLKGGCHFSVLHLMIQYHIYHTQSLKFQCKSDKFIPERLSSMELEQLSLRLQQSNGLCWFNELCCKLRKGSCDSVGWTLCLPPVGDALTKNEKRSLQRTQYRVLHFLGGEKASNLLNSDEYPVGAAILRPSFSNANGHISATYKLFTKEIHQGIFEDPSNLCKLIHDEKAIKYIVLAAPLCSGDKEASPVQFLPVDQVLGALTVQCSPAKSRKGYDHFWSAVEAKKMICASGLFCKSNSKRTSLHSVEHISGEIEVVYRLKGADPQVFSQLMLHPSNYTYRILKQKIEQQESEMQNRKVTVISLVEIRSDGRKISINAVYTHTMQSSHVLEVQTF